MRPIAPANILQCFFAQFIRIAFTGLDALTLLVELLVVELLAATLHIGGGKRDGFSATDA